jgi:Tol biopolymer transport system component
VNLNTYGNKRGVSGVISCVIPYRRAGSLFAFLGGTALFQPFASAQQQSAGTIVFTHAPDASAPWPVTDIYSMGADGSNVKVLTNDGHSHTPSWSADGRRILFVHDSTLQTKPAYREEKGFDSYHPVELYVMDKDGSNRHLLRRLEPVIFSAAWSPDGKMLAITCLPQTWINLPPSDEPLRAGLFLLPADGQGEPRLLFRNAFTPSWSPDGKKLAFSVEHPRGLWSVHVANSDGSNDVQLTDPSLIGGSPAWSPDGKLIALDEFVAQGRGRHIFVMNANGSEVRQVTTDPNWFCEHPSWSPDGKQIAFFCLSASAPCGPGVSSTGSVLPACVRRIFTTPLRDAKSQPTQLTEHDGAFPAFAPVP